MTVGMTAAQLEEMILDELRDEDGFAEAITGVAVFGVEGADSNWGCRLIPVSGRELPFEWERRRIATVHLLRQDYHLLVED